MQLHQIFLITSLTSLSSAAESLLGAYIFSRHGDRTPKATPPTDLTDLGYSQIFASGSYYRDRYISKTSPRRIQDIELNKVKQSQLAVSAPVDNVLQNSAQGFLQGLYPAIGGREGREVLANHSSVFPPLGGYQLIPVNTVASGSGSEDSAWLQGSSNCAKAIVSSNNYFQSAEYQSLYHSTLDFYKSVTPFVNGILPEDDMNFKNAYTIFDILNVASIHNRTSPSQQPSPDLISQARTLADTHEFALAVNSSDTIRSISGAVLAAEIVQALDANIKTPAKSPKLNIQFGAYASFLSFFALAGLPQVSEDFYGIPDYASSMAFELFTTADPPSGDGSVNEKDVQVRFLFHNGTASNSSDSSELTAFPLFGKKDGLLQIGWQDFKTGMEQLSVGGQKDWCAACGNSTGVCAAAGASTAGASGDGGVSKPVAGVIGAMVTLAVILGVEALVLLILGLRVVKKRKSGPMEDAHASGKYEGDDSDDAIKA